MSYFRDSGLPAHAWCVTIGTVSEEEADTMLFYGEPPPRFRGRAVCGRCLGAYIDWADLPCPSKIRQVDEDGRPLRPIPTTAEKR